MGTSIDQRYILTPSNSVVTYAYVLINCEEFKMFGMLDSLIVLLSFLFSTINKYFDITGRGYDITLTSLLQQRRIILAQGK